MKQTSTKWTCNRCKKEFDPEVLVQSQTMNVYLKRGMAMFSRRYQWRDIGGDHISDDVFDLCAGCAELLERVITGTSPDRV